MPKKAPPVQSQKKLKVFLSLGFLCLVLGAVLWLKGFNLRPSETEELEQQLIAQNSSCLSARPELSDIPQCSEGSGFIPTGSYDPVGGFFLKCGCRHPTRIVFQSFLSNFYKLVRKRFPSIPVTLVVDRSCVIDCYTKFVEAVGPNEKFNTMFVNGDVRTDYFAQDAFVFGMNEKTRTPSILSREAEYGKGCSDIAGIVRQKVIPGATPAGARDGYYASTDNRGGNILPIAGPLVAVGTTLETPYQKYLSEQGSVVVPLEVSKLPARHVDELFSVVRLPKSKRPAPCDFALIAASPTFAQELVKKHRKELPENVLSNISESLVHEHAEMSERNLQVLKKNFRDILGCTEEIPVIRFPVFWKSFRDDRGAFYKGIWPNPVNAMVVEQHIIIPDPKIPAIRKAIDQQLKPFGITHDFINSDELELMFGGVHCAVKSLNICKKP